MPSIAFAALTSLDPGNIALISAQIGGAPDAWQVDEIGARQVEVKSKDVAELVAAMAGPLFAKTTGAQVPIDGGSDRII